MSQVSTRPRMRAAVPTPYAARLAAFFVVLIGLFGLGPVSAASAAATSPVTQSDLCTAWSQAGSANPTIALASGLTVTATQAQRLGASCTAADAGVALTGASVVATSTGPASGGNAASQVLAAITHAAATSPALKEGDELFKGAVLKNFNATLKLGYFEISGAVDIQFTGGTTSRFLFKGKLFGIDKFSMSLYSPTGGTALPNIGGSPVSFSGTLTRAGNTYTLDVTGAAPSIVLGDGEKQVSVTDASIALNLASGTDPRIHAAVTGKLGIGTAVRAQGALDVTFDEAGLASFQGSGALALPIPAKGTSPAGSVSGSAAFSYTRTPLTRSVTFTGNAAFGDAVVAGATGTIDDQSVSFAGTVSLSNPKVTLKGAVDGIAYFGDNLTGRTITSRSGQQVPAQKGDVLLKTASGSLTAKGVTVGGAASFGSVGTERWATGGGNVDLSFTQPGQPATTIKGAANVSWVDGGDFSVSFSGSIASGDTTVASASGTLDGKKLLFEGTVSSPTLSGKAKGSIYFGTDLAGETVVNRAGATVPATRGDLSLVVTDGRVQLKQINATANLTLYKVGLETWIKTDAQLKVAQTWLSFSGELDNAGNVNLKGAGQVNFDGYSIAFSGTAIAQNGKLVISGGGSFKTGLFTVNLSGTIEKPDAATSVYVLTGKVDFQFGRYSVAGGNVKLTVGEGMTVIFSFKACILFICPNGTYKLYFNTSGGVAKAELEAPLIYAWIFKAAGRAVFGYNVPISTRITGLL